MSKSKVSQAFLISTFMTNLTVYLRFPRN